MKKIENIIDSCRECRHCQKYVSNVNYGEVWFCGHEDLDKCDDHEHFIAIAGKSATFPTPVIPAWCPLETYKDAEKPESQPGAAPCYIGQPKVDEKVGSTIILPGLPGLEWMTENLQGFGGTEVNGHWYYTWEEAMAAAEQLGNGWRKPTDTEWEALCNLGSTWDEGCKGRWFGGNLFFPAAGYLKCADRCLVHLGIAGYYWSSLPRFIGSLYAADMDFDSSGAYPAARITRSTHGFPVRCVRNVK